MTSTVRVVSCFLACVSMFVCSDASNALLSTTKPPTKIKSPTKITGNNVKGNFQFFGAFCFPEGDSLMQFEIVTKERAPSDLRILFYDDEPSSFNMISRHPSPSNAKSYCYSNKHVSKNFEHCRPWQKCNHGIDVKGMRHTIISAHSSTCPGCHSYRYTQRVKVIDKRPEIWYFLASACDSTDLSIHSYTFSSYDAANCNDVRKRRYASLPYQLADSKLPENQRVTKFADIVDPVHPFVPLGTMCFLKTRDDTSARVTVSFEHQSGGPLELLVFRKGMLQTLFDHDGGTLNAECQRRTDMAEEIMTLAPGSLTSASLTIPTRQRTSDFPQAIWEFVFVLHQGCDVSDGMTKMSVSSFTIEAPDAVECPTTPDKAVLYVDPPNATVTPAGSSTVSPTTTSTASTRSTTTTTTTTTTAPTTTTSTTPTATTTTTTPTTPTTTTTTTTTTTPSTTTTPTTAATTTMPLATVEYEVIVEISDKGASQESNVIVYVSSMVLAALVSVF